MSGEKRWEIWQQGSGGVGGREYLSGWHSNTVSINVSGHLLNQATAAQRDGIRLSLSWNGQSVKQCIKKSGGNGIEVGKLMKLLEKQVGNMTDFMMQSLRSKWFRQDEAHNSGSGSAVALGECCSCCSVLFCCSVLPFGAQSHHRILLQALFPPSPSGGRPFSPCNV